MKYKYICYAYDDEDAPILVIANSEKEMRQDAKEFEGVWYKYEFINNEAINGQRLECAHDEAMEFAMDEYMKYGAESD